MEKLLSQKKLKLKFEKIFFDSSISVSFTFFLYEKLTFYVYNDS